MIKVQSEVSAYELDGTEDHGTDEVTIFVRSSHDLPAQVIIEIDGKRWTALASDLTAAISNATNSGSR